ncbi:DUF5667 domain-containing protein [Streptomyces sp. N2-109]|uniref:DUF5667 domain-containing protein n=1 Tax=Streptomyces gossypii TaxID=2883101 RepID=A0ABT2JWK0_9ACTN|nr:DUF5667 domain-containing protein [Streptomyces gossypii]MCT2592053.1 DUF5667 domain-containing protein [Streptomyces gossypii]
MIGSVSTSRRARAFAQALDEHGREPDGSATEDSATDGAKGERATRGRAGTKEGREAGQSPLLTVAGGLRALPRPELDPKVKSVQRAQLIAAMESACTEGALAGGAARTGRDATVPEQRAAGRADAAGATGAARAGRTGRGAHRAPPLGVLSRLRPRSRLGKRLAAGGLSVGVAASALGGAAVASSDALPGDTLYGLKRGMEGLRLDLAGGDADRGQVYLDNASTRLREARRLVERGRSGSLDHESVSEVRRALSGMRHDAAEGHRLLSAAYERDGKIGRMKSLSSFAEEHRLRWSQLRERLPLQLSEVGEEVSSVFDAIEREVGPVRSLFVAPPEAATGGESPADRRRLHDRDATPTPSPSPSPGADERTERQGTGTPNPSSSEPSQDGLVGGKDLLEPSEEPSDAHSERPAGSAGSAESGEPGESSQSRTPAPDITLPPLVLLPGLGSDTEEPPQ